MVERDFIQVRKPETGLWACAHLLPERYGDFLGVEVWFCRDCRCYFRPSETVTTYGD